MWKLALHTANVEVVRSALRPRRFCCLKHVATVTKSAASRQWLMVDEEPEYEGPGERAPFQNQLSAEKGILFSFHRLLKIKVSRYTVGN